MSPHENRLYTTLKRKASECSTIVSGSRALTRIKTDSGVASGSMTCTTKLGTSHPMYKDHVLEANGIYITFEPDDIPDNVSRATKQIVTRSRDSPGPSAGELDASVSAIRQRIRQNEYNYLQPLDDIFFKAVTNMRRFHGVKHMKFNDCATPTFADDETLPLPCAAKPDYVCGYSKFPRTLQNLNNLQNKIIQGQRMEGFLEPITSMFRPYLVVEVDTGSGESRTAENQAAGGGASCSYIAAKLHELAELADREMPSDMEIPSLVFSVTILGFYAQLFAHWTSSSPNMFMMARIETFDLAKSSGYAEFCTHVKNIHEWALTTRYGYHQKLLEILDAEDKLFRDQSKLYKANARRGIFKLSNGNATPSSSFAQLAGGVRWRASTPSGQMSRQVGEKTNDNHAASMHPPPTRAQASAVSEASYTPSEATSDRSDKENAGEASKLPRDTSSARPRPRPRLRDRVIEPGPDNGNRYYQTPPDE